MNTLHAAALLFSMRSVNAAARRMPQQKNALFEKAKVLQPELREVLDQMQAALA